MNLRSTFPPAERNPPRSQSPFDQQVSTTRATPAEQAGDKAVKRGDWQAASQHYRAALAQHPTDIHGVEPIEALMLRRRAHVAKSMHKRLAHFGLETAFIKKAP